MSATDVRVPDIGDFKQVPVIEVLVKPGDRVKKNDSLVTLESDKASMEIPSSADGVVADVKVKIGDKVSEGDVVITLEGESVAATGGNGSAPAPVTLSVATERSEGAESKGQAPQTIDLVVPDIGDFKDVPVIEVLVKAGDRVEKEAPLVVLESEKASMDVPAARAGTITSVAVKIGDKVSQGSVIAMLAPDTPMAMPLRAMEEHAPQAPAEMADARPTTSLAPARSAQDDRAAVSVHASPSIRKFARELGVDIAGLKGTGPNRRITRDDVQNFVKSALKAGPASAAAPAFAGLPPWPKVDFAQWGEIERKPLARIKKLSGPNLHRNWLQIPHITNFDDADITELEAFRTSVNAEQAKKKDAPKLTMLAFLVKASVAALQRFPEFNASLDGDELVYKKYYNVGFAADTPNGLVVPVLKNADRKGLLEIARESAELAGKARDGKLGLADMQGGTFTISSIGGIGGTAFTQIVNAPEVAILGAVRSTMKPVWDGKAFVPRLILPIDVSYDHRVIDGALAARFLAFLCSLLADYRRVSL